LLKYLSPCVHSRKQEFADGDDTQYMPKIADGALTTVKDV